ncbi:hypothetical protein SELMODRAFT_406727 [Selaginella moellendorffii]|uniref:Uncharacterized protein n=1 Tax=Selaginella moellendorffii TaxID=88036 RepID=D8R196_SELML|nr:hypothetical protein SELMODRAFT_406727 [Selaginella moellendorffii]
MGIGAIGYSPDSCTWLFSSELSKKGITLEPLTPLKKRFNNDSMHIQVVMAITDIHGSRVFIQGGKGEILQQHSVAATTLWEGEQALRERNLENTEADPQCFSTDKASWEVVVRCVLCKGPVKGIGRTRIRRHFCSFYKEKEDTGCCTADISLRHRPIQEFSEEFVSITRNNIETYNIKLAEFEQHGNSRMTQFSNQGASGSQQLDEDAFSVGGSISTPQVSGSIERRPKLNMFAFLSGNDNKAWEWIECLEGEDQLDAERLQQ